MKPELLSDLLDNASKRWGDRLAITDGSSRVTYHDLHAKSSCLADWLVSLGLCPGDRVAVAAHPSATVVSLFFAAAKVGVVFVPLHEQVTGLPLEHVLDDCRPKFLITDVSDDQRRAESRGIGTFPLSGLASVTAVVPVKRIPRPISVDPVCLLYTSGTTSLPKAVVCSHQQMVFATSAVQSVLNYRQSDVIYCALPLSFDYGLYQVFLAAISGAAVFLGRSINYSALLLKDLLCSKATVLPAVPSLAEALVRMLGRNGNESPSLRLITNTGAAVAEDTIATLRARIPGVTVQLMYGLTECKRVAIMPADEDVRRPGSCGLPLPGTEVLVIDDVGTRLNAGEVGEIVVRGPHVMAGYWNRPEQTAQRFPRRSGLFPELHTGDYGYTDEAGYLYFCGRRDDVYKERGFRISAIEVQAAARRVAGVTDAAVLPPTADRPAILVVVSEFPADYVATAMRTYIEAFKIPRQCVVLSEFPFNSNGKVDRPALERAAEEEIRVG
ncbi:class I adenylate-forming enzyme family protein [Streptomyces sp. NBC_00893]|uniref:class I adenylate-forming enzyme family protein n=1 Tax=Streptomyces sp. NBC_00893 TaxID=2975862 RepID=UPI002252A5B2|nr:class I adenylate-forming enzyme family protein [Streptomyces sp. NBC_00893]MCX4850442.1 acyl--CoA ligase [Streptomyces sp. NBC_00893]